LAIIQALPGVFEPIIGQPPNPHSPIGDDERSGGLAQAPPQGLGMQLFTQGIHAFACGHKTPLANHRPPTRRLGPVIQPKTGAGINPMPPFRFLASLAQDLGFAPLIPLPDIPGIHLNDHLVGLQNHLRLHPLLAGTAGLLILLAAQLARPLTLPPRFTIQGRPGQFDSGQMFQHHTGLAHRHLAG